MYVPWWPSAHSRAAWSAGVRWLPMRQPRPAPRRAPAVPPRRRARHPPRRRASTVPTWDLRRRLVRPAPRVGQARRPPNRAEPLRGHAADACDTRSGTGGRTRSGRRLDRMPKTFVIRTFGCQMNEHDSERLAGMLVADGMRQTDDMGEADVVVLNTCCIRENADQKLYGHLGQPQGTGRRQAGPADRRGRLPGPEGPGADPAEGRLGRRGVRDAQPDQRTRTVAAGRA